MAIEQHKPYHVDAAGFYKVVGPDIVRPIQPDMEGWEFVVDTPELARKREANRNRVEHTVFTYTGHERLPNDILFDKPGGGRGKTDRPKKKPPGYSQAFWELQQKQNKKWTSRDMTIK